MNAARVQSPAVHLTVSADLQPIVRPGLLTFDGLTVTAHDPRHGCAARGRGGRASAVRPPDESAAVRGMYRRTGLDPTKRRPSSEALLRRVRKGEALPRINSLVDVCNWCSLEFQLPYGLYDLDRIEGDVILRLGAEGESVPKESGRTRSMSGGGLRWQTHAGRSATRPLIRRAPW